jgi:hypothetical protein
VYKKKRVARRSTGGKIIVALTNNLHTLIVALIFICSTCYGAFDLPCYRCAPQYVTTARLNGEGPTNTLCKIVMFLFCNSGSVHQCEVVS